VAGVVVRAYTCRSAGVATREISINGDPFHPAQAQAQAASRKISRQTSMVHSKKNKGVSQILIRRIESDEPT